MKSAGYPVCFTTISITIAGISIASEMLAGNASAVSLGVSFTSGIGGVAGRIGAVGIASTA